MSESLSDLIGRKDGAGVETVWLGMIEEGRPTADFLDVGRQLKEGGMTDLARELLELLAGHYEEQKQYLQAILVHKNRAYYVNDDRPIRQRLIEVYRMAHADSLHLEDYFELCGLQKGDHLFRALERLDEYLKFDVGREFFFEKYGIGQIVEVFPARREIVLDFERQKHYVVKLEIARGILMPLSPDHFIHRKARDCDGLRQLAEQDPAALVKLILKSLGRPMSIGDIKHQFSGIVPDKDIARVWEKARRVLEKDGNIRVSGKTQRAFEYTTDTVDKRAQARAAFAQADPRERYALAAEYLRRNPDVFDEIAPELTQLGNESLATVPELALDIWYLCQGKPAAAGLNYDADEILERSRPEELIHRMATPEHRVRVLAWIKKRHPDTWRATMRSIYLAATDARLVVDIERELGPDAPELTELHETVLAMPKQYRVQFESLIKRMARGDFPGYLKPEYVPRFFMSLDYIKGIKPHLLKMIDLERFDGFMKQAHRETAEQLVMLINSSTGLADFEKRDYARIVEYYFPELFQHDAVVYVTQESLNKKKAELEHLLTVAIPENKQELSRAREFGDLSENFEYKAAREKQDQLYQKVRDLESVLDQVRVIDPERIDTSRVGVGTCVTLRSADDGDTVQYTILGRWDTDLARNVIADDAPLARSLIGKGTGDRIEMNGREYAIVEIKRGL